MLRVVFDTNVFISALFGGPPEQAYQRVLERRCILIVSPTLLVELARTLREKFHMPEADILAHVKQIGRVAEVVRPSQRLSLVSDEPDNRVLECAEAGRANLIVLGDRDLLGLKQHKGVPIVRPADFVRTLGPLRPEV